MSSVTGDEHKDIPSSQMLGIIGYFMIDKFLRACSSGQ